MACIIFLKEDCVGKWNFSEHVFVYMRVIYVMVLLVDCCLIKMVMKLHILLLLLSIENENEITWQVNLMGALTFFYFFIKSYL